MSRARSSAPGPLPVLLAAGLLLLAAGAFLFGTDPTLRLARASASRVLVDGLATDLPACAPPGLVLTLEGSPEDAPIRCRLLHEGVAYPGRLLRPDDGSWTLELDSLSPLGVRALRLTRPTEPSRLAWKAELDMAGALGLATARLEVVPFRMDGVPQGLWQWGGEVGPDLERLYGLHDRDVPVFSCPSGDPWAPDAEWSAQGPAHATAAAHGRLRALIALLQDRSLPDSLWRDSLNTLVDAGAFLRARVWEDLVLAGERVVPELVAGAPGGRLYPVIPAHPRRLPDSLAASGITDRLLRHPAWKARHAGLLEEARELLVVRGAWYTRVRYLAAELAPCVARDRDARVLLPGLDGVPVRASMLEWETAVEQLLHRFEQGEHGS